MPRIYCKEDNKDKNSDNELLDIIIKLHDINSKNNSNTRKFLSFISIFCNIFNNKSSLEDENKSHLIKGLEKLNEASKVIDELKIKSKEQKILLSEKQKEADIALENITISMAKSNEKKKDSELLKEKLEKETIILNERKIKIENELKNIQPMIDEAKKQVGNIKKDQLNELRMLRLPPQAINDVLSGVLILMGNFDTSWHSMKKFLQKPSVIQEIVSYNGDKVTKEIKNKVSKLLKEKKESFDPVRIKRVSQAAYPLAMWVKANLSYRVYSYILTR